jgi:hypothetical protein
MAAPCLPGTSFAAQTAAEPGQFSDGPTLAGIIAGAVMR